MCLAMGIAGLFIGCAYAEILSIGDLLVVEGVIPFRFSSRPRPVRLQ